MDISKFEKRIKKSSSGCWVWVGNITPQGYGVFSSNKKGVSAHRAAWMFYRGSIPVGMLVCHKCDNPPCVNPDHLFLGSYKDNSFDMMKKNRQRNKDYCNPSHEKEFGILAKNIRKYRRQNLIPQQEFALMLGMSQATVTQIETGRKLPGLETLIRISEALSVEISKLFKE